MKYFITIILLGFILSCKIGTEEINPVWKTQVFNHYKGECTLGIEVYKEGKEKHYNVELIGSENINYFAKNYEIPASNIASIIYKNIENPKPKETNINVKINLENESVKEFNFQGNDFEKIKEFIPVFEEIAEKIKNRKYEELVKDTNSKLPLGHIEPLCDVNNSIYGKIRETQFQGFSFIKREEDNKSFVKLVGINIRGLRNTPFVLVLDEETKVVEGFVFEL